MKKIAVLTVALLFLIVGCASQLTKNARLVVYAQNGDLSGVQSTLKNGAEINRESTPGPTALYMASQNGHLDIVEYLLKNGANVNKAEAVNNTTPLIIALQHGHLEIAKLLLNHDADVNRVSDLGTTALSWASKKGYTEILKLLLKKGAEVGVQNSNLYPPLHSAIKSGSLEAVEILLKAGADADMPLQDGWIPIEIAAYYGHDDIVNTLVRHGVKQTLYTYCAISNIAKVQEMVRSKQDANRVGTSGYTPLHFAVRNRRLKVSRYLLDNGADPNYRSKVASPPLFAAVESHDETMVRFLLDNQADIEIRDEKGFTPLHIAAQLGDTAIAKLFLEKGVPVDAISNDGRTALYVAVFYDHTEMVKALIGYHTDVQKGPNGWTPFHIAAQNGNIEIARVLLENGASLNTAITDKTGSPLHYAYLNKRSDMMNFLAGYFGNMQADKARQLLLSGDMAGAIAKLESSVKFYDYQLKRLSDRSVMAPSFMSDESASKQIAKSLNTTLHNSALKTRNAALLGQTAVNDLTSMRANQANQANQVTQRRDLVRKRYFGSLYTGLKKKYSDVIDCIKNGNAASICLPL